MRIRYELAFCVLLLAFFFPNQALAQERLCDTAYEDCRQPLLNLINAETVGIDVAFWYMEDNRYSNAIISRFQAGVPVRVFIDPRSSDGGKHPQNLVIINNLTAAGIPIRKKNGGAFMHLKFMLFAGQNTVQFGAANYNPFSFVPNVPNVDYVDEAIYFSNDSAVVNSFKTKVDDMWTDTSRYTNYANISGPLTRIYPTFPIDPELNFPPSQSYPNRLLPLLSQETQALDVFMFRITDDRYADEMIAAVQRGVPARLISDPAEYRNSNKLWHSYNIDRMFANGVQIKHDSHEGDAHQKSVILYSKGMVVWGSNNWASSSMDEHNYFTKKGWFFQWFVDQFTWKWNSTTAYTNFVPLPPDKPVYNSPADGALGQSTNVTLKWQGGPWAHKYDIYFGTDPNPPLFIADHVTGSPEGSTLETLALTGLTPGVTYYWRVVSKTMANQAATNTVWSFSTAGGNPPPTPPTGLVASALSDYQISLMWDDVIGETGYKIERSLNGTSGWTEIGTTTADTTTYLDTNSGLKRGTKYFYRVRAFNTTGHSSYSATANATTTQTPLTSSDIVLYASEAPVRMGGWTIVSDTSAAGGSLISHPNANAPTVNTPLSNPTHYFEMNINVESGVGYRLWIRGKADKNAVANDSVYVQFSNSVNSAGSPVNRIGTTSATTVVIEGCTSCGLSGWGWEDNGWNGLGELIYFQTAGQQTIRIQTREDGLSIDQIVLSPNTYLTNSPGAQKNDAVILPKTNGTQPPSNQPPQVSINASPTSGSAPLNVNFTSNASDPDGSIAAYAWNFGDGQTSTQPSPSHVYQTGGTYTARLTVTDNQGATSSASTVITAIAAAGPGTVVLYASEAGVKIGNWNAVADSSAAGGARMANLNLGASKVNTPLANPADYFEITFNAEAGKPYRLWLRAKAEADNHNNDSVYVQFSGSVTSSGSAVFRIGTTSATTVALESCSGCGLSGWGWEDNGWNGLGDLIYFETTGPQTLRVQVREDGLSIDQIVISPDSFLNTAPGPQKNDSTILNKSSGGGSSVTVTGVSPNSGTTQGGTSVTINGSGFSTGATVKFDNLSATNVTVVNSASITATTPAHAAGAVNVKVTNPDGQNGMLTNGFTYTSTANQPPQVTINASPSSGIAPLTVNFTSNASDPDGQVVSYSWNFGDGGTSTATNPSHVYNSTGTFTVSLTVTDNGGATATATTTVNVQIKSSDIVLYASEAGVKIGNWNAVADSSAAGGARMANPNLGASKVNTPLANPADYFEITFNAEAGKPYRLWLRAKAESDNYNNDSVYVQFSGSVTSSGSAVFRIGTTSATTVALESCSGCGLSGWGWEDNGWNGLGDLIYFETTGPQTLRVQVREDGLSIDQIVISPDSFLNTAPGSQKNNSTILPENNSSSNPEPPASITLVRDPYLQKATSESVTVVWATREPGPAEAQYWVDGATANQVAASSTYFSSSQTGLSFDYYQHEADISNLDADTTYNYDIFVDDVDATPLTTDQFETAPAAGTGDVQFIAFGDSGIGSAQQQQLATAMTTDTFDLALHSGDVAYGTSDTTGGASYRQYNDWFFDIYRDWLRSRPFFPSIGNHDNQIANAKAYRDVFVLPENGESQAFPDHKERYYSFDYGPIHFIALDTELAFQNSSRRQEQLAWLEADLASAQQPWRIVYFHRSPFSSSQNHGSDLAVRQAFAPLFEQYGVQIVISAHDHDYERSVPWRESQSNQAVTYIVSGGGGAQLYAAGQSPWTASAISAYHYVKGTVSGCQIVIEAVGLNGSVFDQYILDRCAQASDQASPAVSIQTPANGETVSGMVQVQVQASDDVRVEKVDLWINGALAAIDIEQPYEFSWDTSAVVDGNYTLEARTYDIAGNQTSSEARNVQVENAPSAGEGDIVLYASDAPVVMGSWSVEADSTAAGSARMANPDQGASKVNTPLANPADYFEITFNAEAGRAYRLWLRAKAEADHHHNDSVHVQFSGSETASGNALYRIGTTSATTVALESCSGCGLSGWGWEDNGWNGLGDLIYFGTTGPQTLRVQVREDGLSIDQIVISSDAYLNTAPGSQKDDSTILPRMP